MKYISPLPPISLYSFATKTQLFSKKCSPCLKFQLYICDIAAHKANNAWYKLQCVLVDYCHQFSWQPNLGTYYPRGHGLFTNILSLLGNGRLLFRCHILAVNRGRIILSNNNNLLPTCKLYLHRNNSKSPILYWIIHVW